MTYTSRYNEQQLTVEEGCVLSALQEYTDERIEGATDADWVPTTTVLQTNRTWYAKHLWRWDYDRPERLTLRQFGRAVRRVPECQAVQAIVRWHADVQLQPSNRSQFAL